MTRKLPPLPHHDNPTATAAQTPQAVHESLNQAITWLCAVLLLAGLIFGAMVRRDQSRSNLTGYEPPPSQSTSVSTAPFNMNECDKWSSEDQTSCNNPRMPPQCCFGD